LQKADVMIVGGSADIHTAKEAARLFKGGWTPIIIFSGGLNTRLRSLEADALATVALSAGVPESAILKEREARHTGENVTKSHALLSRHNIRPKKVMLVHTPPMMRRFVATAKAQWPGNQPEFLCRHEDISLRNYCKRMGEEETIRRILGHVERMQNSWRHGFQAFEVIPDEVAQAFDSLIQQGYTARPPHAI
jgi:hypothetical protein